MKSVLATDHIPRNKFRLLVLGFIPFDFTAIRGIDQQLEMVDLPNRSRASAGRTLPLEFTVELPLHLFAQQLAMLIWFQESQDPVTPFYKKPATLLFQSLSGDRLTSSSFTMFDLFVSGRRLSDFEMNDDGAMAMAEWTMQASDMIPI